jgi:two-component system OmpR family response regulator
MRILLVEDHAELADQIATRIEHGVFEVDRADTIESARESLQRAPYVLTLMDRRLPDGDGLSLVPEIRVKQPGIRILMLTALDAVDDKIGGLDAGADDYLTKPFNLEEMMARIRASLRRPGGDPAPPIVIGALSFDLCARAVSVNGHPILLHRRELTLLEVLVRRVGRVVGRKPLMAEIYGLNEEIQPHALTILVSRLRSRLDELGAGVEIHTARGVGYLITKTKP